MPMLSRLTKQCLQYLHPLLGQGYQNLQDMSFSPYFPGNIEITAALQRELSCMCTDPSGIAAVILPGSKTTMTLEKVLEIDNKIYSLGQASHFCEQCCSKLDCTIELLSALEQLAVLYQGAHTRYASAKMPIPEHKATHSVITERPAQQVSIEPSSILFGCVELGEEESNAVSTTIIKCALGRLQVTTKAFQRRTLETMEQLRIPLTAEDHRMMAKGADIDARVEAILSRIWETIAYGRL